MRPHYYVVFLCNQKFEKNKKGFPSVWRLLHSVRKPVKIYCIALKNYMAIFFTVEGESPISIRGVILYALSDEIT